MADHAVQFVTISDNEAVINKIDTAFLNSNTQAVTLVASDATMRRLMEARPYVMNGTCLTRSSWNKATPFLLEVGDLEIRPVGDNETGAFVRMIQDEQIARMLVNLDHPLEDAAARRWIRQRRFTGRPGFQLGVFQGGDIVGSIGISALSHALVYFLLPQARGKGHARSFVAPFVHHTAARWRLPQIFAGVFCDNPASRHILERSGFAVTGFGVVKSPARQDEAQFWEMTFVPDLDRQLSGSPHYTTRA